MADDWQNEMNSCWLGENMDGDMTDMWPMLISDRGVLPVPPCSPPPPTAPSPIPEVNPRGVIPAVCARDVMVGDWISLPKEEFPKEYFAPEEEWLP